MFDTREQLQEKIRLGEDSLLECKAMTFAGDKIKGPKRDDVADELAAFANASGGVVVLGVEDKTREILGIPAERLDLAERFVNELCNDLIKPPLFPRIERLQLTATDGTEQPVIRVDVARSLFVHKSPGGYFYRVGSAKRQMTTEYLARLTQQRSQAGLIRFDEQVILQASLDDLDAALVDRFRTSRTTDDRAALLRKLAMAREGEDGVLRPTVAGILLGSTNPERWLPHAFVQAVAYRGDGAPGAGDLAEYQLDAKDIVGPLDAQVVEACRFVTRNMRVGASKSAGRTDVPQYDITAIFEAIVNAVAHRDYSMYGSKIRLRLFANHLEVFSPGSLSNTMTVDSLAVRQSSRNEAITSLLAKCAVPTELSGMESARSTMMDRRGEGVSIILERSQQLAKRRPVFELPDESELKLTIFAAPIESSTNEGART
ncbi:Divergent AAA domain protein [Phycisphaerae bacterium RAS2]|nr:Divergent AAA domain protein [Phycisphaerae bacterium RAS2]